MCYQGGQLRRVIRAVQGARYCGGEGDGSASEESLVLCRLVLSVAGGNTGMHGGCVSGPRGSGAPQFSSVRGQKILSLSIRRSQVNFCNFFQGNRYVTNVVLFRCVAHAVGRFLRAQANKAAGIGPTVSFGDGFANAFVWCFLCRHFLVRNVSGGKFHFMNLQYVAFPRRFRRTDAYLERFSGSNDDLDDHRVCFARARDARMIVTSHLLVLPRAFFVHFDGVFIRPGIILDVGKRGGQDDRDDPVSYATREYLR